MEYAPEDFSQSAINRGQRNINYALTMVNERLVKALEAFKETIAALDQNIDLTDLSEAISEADELNQKVAGIKPPGCEPWPQ